jgi:hypothetical protein
LAAGKRKRPPFRVHNGTISGDDPNFSGDRYDAGMLVTDLYIVLTSQIWLNRPTNRRRGCSSNPVSGISSDLYEVRADFAPGTATQVTFTVRGVPIVYNNTNKTLPISF